MIVVIADDLTGAAELGGLSLSYGLQVEVNTQVSFRRETQVLIIATDTRSGKKHEAELQMARITSQVKQLQPELIFKKVDSVLRGFIAAEIKVQLRELNFRRALLIPANPSLGRIIKDGNYFIDGKPLHLTAFSKDPEFSARSSAITDLLGSGDIDICIKKKDEKIDENGIIAGEAENNDDLRDWVKRLDQKTLAAGAAGFFSAIIESITGSKVIEQKPLVNNHSAPQLIVCGSAFSNSVKEVKKVKSGNGPVSYMPAAIANSEEVSDDSYAGWASEIILLIKKFGCAVVAIDPTILGNAVEASDLRTKTGRVINKVFRRQVINELLIEGGSTASAILRELELSEFRPADQLAPGVIRLASGEKPGLYITLKPGSYPWPEHLWKF